MLGLQHAALTFKSKGLGDNGNRERAELSGERRDDGSGPAARAPAEAGRDEDHVRAFERLDNAVRILERRLAANLGIGAGTQALGELRAELELGGSLAEFERLQVGIGGDEFDALDLRADHAVHGIAAATADTNNFNFRALLELFAKRKADASIFWSHISPSIFECILVVSSTPGGLGSTRHDRSIHDRSSS